MSLYLGTTPIANDGSHRITGEIGDMGFAPLGIDESLNLRRYLNGQVISQTQFVSFTTKVKSAVALFPSLATTEVNWQAEKALSKFGQVGKFVIDDENQTIRLPAVVNAQGLLGLSGIGNLVNESLPNITGNVSSLVDRHSGVFLATEVSSAGIAGGSVGKIYDNNFDASRCSSTYQNNAPVQQEAIQYPYYIQVATGVEETLPAIREYEINTPFFFGQSMYSENASYNASWLASNGSYNASSVYPDFWTQLTGVELNGSLNVGDTIEISGKTYVKRGLPVVLSTGTITDYDFVVNQNDQSFRLPLLNGEEDLTGNTYEEITVKPSGSTYAVSKNGAYNLVVACTTTTATANAGILLQNVTAGIFDGDQITGIANYKVFTANIKAKKGDTVRLDYYNLGTINNQHFRFIPAVGNGTLYYYVGDTVQDASLINAGAVLGQLSNKADIDASNFNADGKSLLSGLSMPANQAQQLTLLASGQSYTAPSNGWFSVIAAPNNGSYILLNRSDSTMRSFYFNSSAGAVSAGVFLPVLKGTSVSYTYVGTFYNNSNSIYFIPAKGEN